MHPSIQTLTAEIAAAKRTLGTPSPNDPTFRAMLIEILHGQQMQDRVSSWLDGLPARLADLDQQIEDARDQRRASLSAVPDEAPDAGDEEAASAAS